MKSAGGKSGWLGALAELTKVRISLLATLSTATGYILATGRLSPQLVATAAGIFILACASSALNHFQESRYDALMSRTRGRPIPSGRVAPYAVLLLSAALFVAGSLVLLYSAGSVALGLGLFAAVWYNGVYTYLKRVTAFAVIPGSLVGAIPPVVGWVAGGGSPLAPQIIAVASFFFVWQVPHFWLLLLAFGKEYEAAGLPSLSRTFAPEQLGRITYAWIAATAATGVLLLEFGIVRSATLGLVLFLLAAWLLWSARSLARGGQGTRSFRRAFVAINEYALLVMAVLVAARILMAP